MAVKGVATILDIYTEPGLTTFRISVKVLGLVSGNLVNDVIMVTGVSAGALAATIVASMQTEAQNYLTATYGYSFTPVVDSVRCLPSLL